MLYEDKIEFYTEDGVTRFFVPIRAVIIQPEYYLPRKIRFDLVGVDDSIVQTVLLENRR